MNQQNSYDPVVELTRELGLPPTFLPELVKEDD
jgi:hypothetical protein